jgi:hypothetical protein
MIYYAIMIIILLYVYMAAGEKGDRSSPAAQLGD